jgi:hypothetical protein
MEVWKTVPSFPFFEVSDLGRVRSKKRLITHRNKHGQCTRQVGGSVLDGWVNPRTGYTQVTVSDFDQDGRRTRQAPKGLHTLVCEAFHGPKPENKSVVAHRDGDPGNNKPDNLYWATYLENEEDKGRHGRRVKGADHPNTKLTEVEANWIRGHYKPRSKTYGAQALAQKFGVHRTTIENIVSGRTWD